MTGRHVLFLALWLGVIGTALFVATTLAPSAEAQPVPCPAADARPGSSKPKRVAVIRAEDPKDEFLMHFGDSRKARSYAVPLTGDPEVSRADGLRPWLVTYYLENSRGDQISLEQDPQIPTGLEARLIFTSRTHLQLCLTVIPQIVRQLGLGRYSGTIAVGRAADEVPMVTLPVELTFRASYWRAFLFGFLGVCLGLTVKVLSEAAAGQRVPGVGARQALKHSVANLTFPVTLIVGFLAGWIVFRQIYGGDRDWGASGADVVALIVACFLVQMSSVEGVDLVKKVASPPSGSS